MQLFKQSEGTAARRRFYVHCVDAGDGITPETGEAGGLPQISKNGGTLANTSATLTAIGNGAYYVELTTDELDTFGAILVRYKSANTAEFQDIAYVVAFDPYDAAGFGLSRIDATISTRAPESGGNVEAIKDKTDNLPADPASDSTVAKEATVNALPAAIDAELSSSHGSGSWEGGTPPTPEEIEEYFANIHGSGTWEKGADYKV